ncbi:HisA/HisF-related TIM barrel protein, partial [Myxococcota bacterium]|nr:HisA/HisF-related TIM barrel protein [Myxococcota bacterium]
LTKTLSELVRLPVIASGGAGKPKHLLDVLTEGKADAAFVASMVHYGDYSVSGLKTYLNECGVKVRMSW